MKGGGPMETMTRLGPADHGRPVTLEEYESADYEEGCQYELIDGKLYVTPVPNPPQNRVDHWLFAKVWLYSQGAPDSINFVSNKARIVVPNRPGATRPEPDLAAYRDYPLDLAFEEVRWENLSPILVGEVLSLDDPDKDLVRNVELYFQVPSIREYWLFDTRAEGAERPTLRVHRRWGGRWRILDLAFGATYATRLLPGFELVVDPRR